MLIHIHRQWLVGLLGVAALVLTPNLAAPQDSKSAPLAKELAQLLDQQKLSTFAAKDPVGDDTYVAAMYFPNSQLLVVSARYAVPVYANEKLAKKDYMEVYIDRLLDQAACRRRAQLSHSACRENGPGRTRKGNAHDARHKRWSAEHGRITWLA